MKKLCVWAVAALLMAACTPKAEKATDSGLLQSNFRTEVDGKKTDLYILRNKNNMEVCITNFGGRIVSVMVPDKDGQMRDVVLGFDSIQDYISKPSDFGASIGRYANRINQGKFTLDGVEYQLPRNNYGHCLHGGPQGFQYRVYDAVQLNPQELQLTYVAKDGEEGFPGNITCKVLMKLTDDNAIDIQYEAETDKPTIVNMTNHSYFNLSAGQEKIYHHQLYLNADQFGCVDDGCLATGELHEVEGTPFDFRQMHEIGEHIQDKDEQLKNAGGYDHTFVLNQGDEQIILYHEPSGRELHIHTSAPQVQLYSGNFLAGGANGKNGKPYENGDGVALETQLQPNSIHVEKEPSVILRKGQVFRSHTSYSFVVR